MHVLRLLDQTDSVVYTDQPAVYETWLFSQYGAHLRGIALRVCSALTLRRSSSHFPAGKKKARVRYGLRCLWLSPTSAANWLTLALGTAHRWALAVTTVLKGRLLS